MPFPTLEEERATSIPVDIVYQAPAMVAGDFLPNDEVQIIRDLDNEPRESAVGVVVAVAGTSLQLGTQTYDSADGWSFELVKRPLVFPTSVSEIDAIIFGVEPPVRLMGKNLVWTTEAGLRVAIDNIVSFVMV